LSLQPRPEVESLEACTHGGPNQAELKAMGLTPEAVLDFSVCSNPLMPPLGVSGILGTIAVNRYPDSEATEFRQCLAERLGVAPDNILVGSGAVELIRLIVLAYFRPGDCALILEPAFGEYRVACQIAGAEVITSWGKEEDGFVPGIAETVSLIQQHHPRGVFICNPNNPTGHYLTRQQVEMILDAGAGGLLILDEAYINFVDESWSSLGLLYRGDVIVVRSMTKDYALAGLRLGYAVASREVIEALHRVRPPWNVSVVAQKAGVAALGDADYLARCQQEIKQAKQFLVDELRQLGFTLVPSRTNFFLVKVADAGTFRSVLLRHGILVRDCTSFGMPGYIRIAPRIMPECQQLITVLQSLKQQGELETVFAPAGYVKE